MTAPEDTKFKEILSSVRVIALLGASPRPERPSNTVMRFLQSRGYKVVPVNPGLEGNKINEEPVYAQLADIPFPIDMVDIFRSSAAAGEITDEAIRLAPEKGIKVIWMQIGVTSADAAARAEAAGLAVVMNRCPKIEYARLMT